MYGMNNFRNAKVILFLQMQQDIPTLIVDSALSRICNKKDRLETSIMQSCKIYTNY